MQNVIDLLKSQGVEPKKVASTNGGEWHSPCPGCGGRDRFMVWPEQPGGAKAVEAGAGGTYYCRQCEKSGDAIQFLVDFAGCDFSQACAKLGLDAKSIAPQPRAPKIPGKKHGLPFIPAAEAQATPTKLWVEKAGKFTSWAHEQLLANDAKLRWLLRRGIRRDTVRKYRLGWNPGKDGKDLYRAREGWGLETVLKKNGRRKALWLPIGLVIPMADGDQIVRFPFHLREPLGASVTL